MDNWADPHLEMDVENMDLSEICKFQHKILHASLKSS